tara:strand:+ start:1470 stop:1724 length:255 start_codon:yes stop_codon:yes gene_type:complete
MKFFIYKSLIVCLITFLTFHLTFGYVIKSYKNKIFNTFSKDKIFYLKEITRNEIKKSLQKERILDSADAKLLREIINKFIAEIN